MVFLRKVWNHTGTSREMEERGYGTILFSSLEGEGESLGLFCICISTTHSRS